MDRLQWSEKYRPKTIDDLVIDSIISTKLHNMLKDYTIPNIIISGVPGVGKTSTIRCIANHLYGKYKKDAVFEFTVSEDRGIKVVQDTITRFCKKKMSIGKKSNYAKHKLIIIDDADNITPKAQQLIDMLIEQYHETTRFAFSCNNSYNIIEAIQSRCTILRYQRLSTEKIIERLTNIADNEGVKYTKKAIESIAFMAQGDMRSAINNLQLAHSSFGKLDEKKIVKLCDEPQPVQIETIINHCRESDIYTVVVKLKDLLEMGYSPSDVALGTLNVLKYMSKKDNDPILIKYMREISQTCMVISKGVVTDLQLTGCFMQMVKLSINAKK